MAASSSAVPTLQSLALQAVANAVNTYEPEAIHALPYGGAMQLISSLAKDGRLRPETLRPLLLSDWSSAAALSSQLGESLAVSAPGCRGLSALAAQRLHFQARRRQQDDAAKREELLPFGTRKGDAANAAAADDLRKATVR